MGTSLAFQVYYRYPVMGVCVCLPSGFLGLLAGLLATHTENNSALLWPMHKNWNLTFPPDPVCDSQDCLQGSLWLAKVKGMIGRIHWIEFRLK